MAGVASGDEPQLNAQTVNSAVSRAVEWIKSQRKDAGHWEPADAPGDRYWAGDTALATLALLYANEDARESDMAKSLEWLAAQPVTATYVYALRAHVLALAPGEKYRKRLESDLDWLLDSPNPPASGLGGAFSYESLKNVQASPMYDNSNSQFGVLGVWMATEAGARSEKLTNFWRLVEQHWLNQQNADGGWSYQKGQDQLSTGSMTAAGLTTMYVVLDRAYGRSGQRKAENVVGSINRALDWFGGRFGPENPSGSAQWQYYYLYGVERAGRASGRKYFRDRDWFRVGASWLLSKQQADGSWGGLHDTCFALMFLCHGRAPIFYNKLEKGDDWDRTMRDAANLVRFSQRNLERLFNWQIISLDNTIEDLLEAPVLYVSGAGTWEFNEAERLRLQQYVDRGGMILAAAPPGKSEFRTSIEELARDLWPRLRLQRLRPTHPLLSGAVQTPIDHPPELLEIRSDTRTLLLLMCGDAPANWNRYATREAAADFQLGVNIYLYATDKTTIESRFQTIELPYLPREDKRTIRAARMKFDGRWDVETYGWERLKTYMHNECGINVSVSSGVSFADPALKDFAAVHVTGIGPFSLNSEEVAGLRRFLTGGGTLIADAAMGKSEFLDSFETVIGDVLKSEPVRLPANSPILTGQRIEQAGPLNTVEYRRTTRAEGRSRETPPLKAFMLADRPAVIYSPLDISVGLVGSNVYECRGYDAAGCLAIMRNLLLFAGMPPAERTRLLSPATDSAPGR
ncbi:MAG: DUF4159 domain-containing protein [Planctomycetes bacterium]|nr:DUF4159 domain-containing protein [Planctomycetota bacterium]